MIETPSEVSSEAVEAAARALVREQSGGTCEFGRVCNLCDCDPGSSDAYALDHARVALTAALPYLVPEGTQPGCTGAPDCPAPAHVHGCYADAGHCDDPQDHESALSPRVVPSAEEGIAEARRRYPYDDDPGTEPVEVAADRDAFVEGFVHAITVVRDAPTVAEVREQVARELEALLPNDDEVGNPSPCEGGHDCHEAARYVTVRRAQRIARGETKGGE